MIKQGPARRRRRGSNKRRGKKRIKIQNTLRRRTINTRLARCFCIFYDFINYP